VDWFVSILENLVVFPHYAKLARPLLVSSLKDIDNRFTRGTANQSLSPPAFNPIPFPIIKEANVTIGFAFLFFTMASFYRKIMKESEAKAIDFF